MKELKVPQLRPFTFRFTPDEGTVMTVTPSFADLRGGTIVLRGARRD